MSASPSSPSFLSIFRTSRVRRGFAACAVVLAAGGLVLVRAPSSARSDVLAVTTPTGPATATFTGPGAHGQLALSHGKILGGAPGTFYAELVLSADASEEAKQRAPLSLAVVLDRSGSMSGDKIEQAKNSVVELIRTMQDDDEIAVVQYDNEAQVVQHLARVGAIREDLIARVRAISSGGGTNIPAGLSSGLNELAEAGRGHVRRVVLASDGLDSTRAQAEELARTSAQRGITISSMGIGLDFDEGYMGGVARSGRGNFAFVKDASALAGFLKREVKEGASTTIENATAKLVLPAGVTLVRAVGADVRPLTDVLRVDGGNAIELSMGALFAGDERRVIIELKGDLPVGAVRSLSADVAWNRVGGGSADVKVASLEIAGAATRAEVDAARDGSVFADAVSATASLRQLEATEAYNRGEGARAQALIEANEKDLQVAASAAPAPKAAALGRQQADYEESKRAFAAAPPTSDAGKAAAKAGAARDFANQGRASF